MNPLTGIRVLDFSRLYPGPLAGHLLAEMGADVIKIEDPSQPDYIGQFPPFIEGESVNDLALNRLKTKKTLAFIEDAAVLQGEIRQADVLIESFRPGVMQSWGLDPETLLTWNSRLIGVSLSAFGNTHPWSAKPGHDLNILALSGGLFLNGGHSAVPRIPSNQWVDVAAAKEVVTKVLCALFQRSNTQNGTWIEVSMLESIKSYFQLQWVQAQTEPMFLNMLNGTLPCYNIYPTKDQRWMALGALEHKFWQRFCKSLNQTSWLTKGMDPGPKGHDLKKEVGACFQKRSLAEWTTWEEEYGPMCLSPVLTPQEALEHFQMVDFKGIKFP